MRLYPILVHYSYLIGVQYETNFLTIRIYIIRDAQKNPLVRFGKGLGSYIPRSVLSGMDRIIRRTDQTMDLSEGAPRGSRHDRRPSAIHWPRILCRWTNPADRSRVGDKSSCSTQDHELRMPPFLKYWRQKPTDAHRLHKPSDVRYLRSLASLPERRRFLR